MHDALAWHYFSIQRRVLSIVNITDVYVPGGVVYAVYFIKTTEPYSLYLAPRGTYSFQDLWRGRGLIGEGG